MIENFFTFDNIKKKFDRELYDIKKAEQGFDDFDAARHAVNAAITLLHAIEWRYRDLKPENKDVTLSLAAIVRGKNNDALELLYRVAIYSKHLSVRAYKHKPDIIPSVQDNIINIITEDGSSICTEDGSLIISEDSKVEVCFDGKPAIDILQECQKLIFDSSPAAFLSLVKLS